MVESDPRPSGWQTMPHILQGRYAVKRMGVGDIPSLMQLRNVVLAELGHPDAYVREDNEEAFILDHCGQRGETIGLFSAGPSTHLIAYAMVCFPGSEDSDNLGVTVGLPVDELDRVGILSGCMVAKEYRGHGLQLQLLLLRQLLCSSHGRTHCLSMISLHNTHSRFNLFRLGMVLRWIGVLSPYGLRRQLAYIDQETPMQFDMLAIQEADPLNFERQVDLSRAGWWAIRERVNSQGNQVLEFARPLPACRSAS